MFLFLKQDTFMYILKPFDIVVALKIGLNEKALRQNLGSEGRSTSNSVSDLANSLYKAKGDVSRAINRLIQLGLVSERQPRDNDVLAVNRKYYSIQRHSLVEFLCFGIRHVFAPENSGYGRGVPSGWSCPLIKSPMNPPEVPLVWAKPGGDVLGEFIEPLYAKCVDAVAVDPGLYELLSLIDIVRTGKPREIKYAKELIQERVKELHS